MTLGQPNQPKPIRNHEVPTKGQTEPKRGTGTEDAKAHPTNRPSAYQSPQATRAQMAGKSPTIRDQAQEQVQSDIQGLPLYTAYKKLSPDFKALVMKRAAMKMEIREMEQEVKDLNARLMGEMAKAGVKLGVRVDDYGVRVLVSHGPSKLNPKMLVEKGVDPGLISECTIAGQPYTYLEVREIKQKEEGGGEYE